MTQLDPQSPKQDGTSWEKRVEKHLADSVSKSPASSLDNVIAQGAGAVGLVVKRSGASETADLLQVQDETGVVLGGLSASGGVIGGSIAAIDPTRRPYSVVADGTATTMGTDNTAALQSAINDAISQGRPLLLNWDGIADISGALTINGNLRVIGLGCRELWSSAFIGVAGAAVYDTFIYPVTAPHLSGTIIRQNLAGANGITINGAALSVALSHFGVLFHPSIQLANTGHGIAVTPPAGTGANASKFDLGVIGSTWDGVRVWGHDGNHYGFYVLNSFLNKLKDLRSYGGGGLMLDNNGPTPTGNSVVDAFYGVVLQGGSAHGINLKGTGSGGGNINLIQFLRPQTFLIDPTTSYVAPTGWTSPPASPQANFTCDQATTAAIGLTDADFEAHGSYGPIVLFPYGNAGGDSYVGPGGHPDSGSIAFPNDTGGWVQNTSGRGAFFSQVYEQVDPTLPASISVNVNTAASRATFDAAQESCAPQGRSVADGVTTNASTTVTSATAAFVASDQGAAISGSHIPEGATIASVTNGTTVVISSAATGAGSGVTLKIGVKRFTVTYKVRNGSFQQLTKVNVTRIAGQMQGNDG